MTPEIQRLGEAIAGAVLEVEAYLAAQDVDGADDYLASFREIAGVRAHDIVLRLIQDARGLPDWRTMGAL